MTQTVTVRLNKRRHEQLSQLSEKFNTSISLLLDISVANLIGMGETCIGNNVTELSSAYDKTMDKIVHKTPVAQVTNDADIDELVSHFSTTRAPEPVPVPKRDPDISFFDGEEEV